MQLILLKNLTVSMLVGTAVTTSAFMTGPMEPAAVATFDQVEVKAEANIDARPKVSATVAAQTVPAVTAAKAVKSRPDALDLWINRLVHLESGGREDVKVLDTNNHYSYGCLQFQRGTFITYGVRYGLVGPSTNVDEAIMSCSIQKQIARRMILEDVSNWRHWFTSVETKNLGYPPVSR